MTIFATIIITLAVVTLYIMAMHANATANAYKTTCDDLKEALDAARTKARMAEASLAPVEHDITITLSPDDIAHLTGASKIDGEGGK